MDREALRHQRMWSFFTPLCRAAMRLLLNYRAKPAPDVPFPALIVSNHVTNLDPVLLGCSFRRQMYFIAADNVFRMGVFSKLLSYAFAPIRRVKGASGTGAAMAAIRNIREGHNVCLFAEGNRCFCGSTLPILPATGKLAKTAGGGLVTYRFAGGYLSQPRWAAALRRGRMEGGVVSVYSPEELKKLTPEAINQLIRRDIACNAYAEQEASPIAYRGRRPAENLELALYLCPRCGGRDTLKSRGDRFFCGCGLELRLDKYGFFAGGDRPFAHPGEWDSWQTEQLGAILESSGGGLIYSDTDVILYRRERDNGLTELERGELRLYAGRLELGGRSFELSDIGSAAMELRDLLVFEAKGERYLLTSERLRGFRKYLQMYELIRSGQPHRKISKK